MSILKLCGKMWCAVRKINLISIVCDTLICLMRLMIIHQLCIMAHTHLVAMDVEQLLLLRFLIFFFINLYFKYCIGNSYKIENYYNFDECCEQLLEINQMIKMNLKLLILLNFFRSSPVQVEWDNVNRYQKLIYGKSINYIPVQRNQAIKLLMKIRLMMRLRLRNQLCPSKLDFSDERKLIE